MDVPLVLRGRAVAALILLAASAAVAAPGPDFTRDILPILSAHCFECHGPDDADRKAKLRLDVPEGALGKGESGDLAIVPGKSAESEVMRRIASADADEVMPPPKTKRKLTARQIELLKSWIDGGAKWGQHWAFVQPKRAAFPEGSAGHSIDRFLAAKMEQPPAPEASKPALLRRVSVDLIGLPPTRDELQAFLADEAPDAYERLVERLLNDPRHGERWARHWMDVWRYSDWYGRRLVPDVWNSAPQIWRWRDWIVRSLNADKGYDRMVKEMLAADEVAPGDLEARVATGYLVRNWYALNPNQWMRDNVEHTAKAFLGLTMNCAHCHDHKYDPLTREDYFNFRAFFEPIYVRQDRVPGDADPGKYQDYNYSQVRKIVRAGAVTVFDKDVRALTWLYHGGDERNRQTERAPARPAPPGFLEARVQVEPVKLPTSVSFPGGQSFVRQDEVASAKAALAAAEAKIKPAGVALTSANEKRLATAGCRPEHVGEQERVLEDADLALRVAEKQAEAARVRQEAIAARIAADDAKFLGAPGELPKLAAAAGQAEQQLAVAQARVAALEAEQVLRANDEKVSAAADPKQRETATAARKKAEIDRDLKKQALTKAETAAQKPATDYTPLSPVYPRESSGRRRALAEWIVGRENPLAARVAVNHIWLRHFHTPLVATVYDFGRSGAQPTHPELFDWLAVELMESGWSMKHLHRLIVTSGAYRRVSASAEAAPKDPANRTYWRMNPARMEAEAVRDGVLHLAGQLDGRMGGQELETADMATSRRRTLYFASYPEIGGKGELTGLFDAPDPNDCYRRSESILPQQALALTNSQLVHEASGAIAQRLWAALDEPQRQPPAFITAAFEQLLSRAPAAAELAECTAFLTRQADAAKAAAKNTDGAARARDSLVRVLLNHHEFVTVK